MVGATWGVGLVFWSMAWYLGVFVYLIARGHKMNEHAAEDAAAVDGLKARIVAASPVFA